jgi:hypothetical protein
LSSFTDPVAIPSPYNEQTTNNSHPLHDPSDIFFSMSAGSGGGTNYNAVNTTARRNSVEEELARACAELDSHRAKVAAWEDGLRQARQACEAWKREADAHRTRAAQAETECRRVREERDAALAQLAAVRQAAAQHMKQQRAQHTIDSLQTLFAVRFSTVKTAVWCICSSK